ncbi:unnamed protein product, partial [Musa textilis]
PLGPLRRFCLLIAPLLAPVGSDTAGIGFEFHRWFSDRVRSAESRAIGPRGALRSSPSPSRPPPRLTAVPPTCSAPWDCKPSPPPLGLRYAFVELGTPNVTFLVALDTGSDLFRVPCDCHQCAAAKFDNFEFHIYSTSNSSTSQRSPATTSYSTTKMHALQKPGAALALSNTCLLILQLLES